MVYKRKKTHLGLYQSKAKRRKVKSNSTIQPNILDTAMSFLESSGYNSEDDISTDAYSDHNEDSMSTVGYSYNSSEDYVSIDEYSNMEETDQSEDNSLLASCSSGVDSSLDSLTKIDNKCLETPSLHNISMLSKSSDSAVSNSELYLQRNAILRSVNKYLHIDDVSSVNSPDNMIETQLEQNKITRSRIVSNVKKYMDLEESTNSSTVEEVDTNEPDGVNYEKEEEVNDFDVSNDHDFENCDCHLPEYLSYAADMFKSENILIPFIKKLHEKDILDDFLLMVKLVANGNFHPDDITLMLAVEKAKMLNCQSTTGMRYRPETLDYWTVFYRVCHTSGLNLASGAKHAGHVTGLKCKKGKYDPESGSFNFAVPDVKTLLNHQKRIDKYVNPGIIEGSFALLNMAKQYVLEYDGKRLASGLESGTIGEINMWGYEGPPSLQDSKDRLQRELNMIDQLKEVQNEFSSHSLQSLRTIVTNISKRIKDKRMSLMGYEKYKMDVEKMCDGQPKLKKKYNKSLQDTNAMIHVIKTWIKSALQLNDHLCLIMAKCNSADGLWCHENQLNISKQPNARLLYTPEEIGNTVNLDDHPYLVKQRSKKWLELRKLARVTGSTLYRSLGLDTLKNQRQHYDEFVLKHTAKEFPPHVQERIDHGIENEIHAVGTLVSKFMPAFMPPCARFGEDGANFVHGHICDELLEVSTDGFIKCPQHYSNVECTNVLQHDHVNCIAEIKCPFPQPKRVTVHYSPPVRYISQLLCGMKCKGFRKCVYISYTKESVTFFMCDFDDTLWNAMWELTQKMYDTDTPTKPIKLDADLPEIRKLINEYIEKNVHFVAELPSVETTEGPYDTTDVQYPYRETEPAPCNVYTEDELLAEILDVCSKAMALTKEAHEISRKRASEILAFLLCDSDREKSSSGIDNIPVAYALKGYSLNCEVMRKMIEHVRNECHSRQISILCEVCDGQWKSIAFNSITGHPLTRMQFQRQCWHSTMRRKKKDMIVSLLSCSQVHPQTLDAWAQETQIMMVPGSHSIGNIKVSSTYNTNSAGQVVRKLSIMSNGGNLATIPVMGYVYTIKEQESPQMWKRAKSNRSDVQEFSHSDVLALLPHDVIDAPASLIGNENAEEMMIDSDDDDASQISDVSGNDDRVNILRTMLNELIKVNKKQVWSRISPRMLYRYHLCDAEAIAQSFVVPELNALNKVFNRFTGQNIFNASENKESKVNKLCAKFGDQSLWRSTRIRIKNPSSLKDLAFKLVNSGKVPKAVVASSAARIHYKLNVRDWENSATIPLNLYVNHRNEFFQLFSFPEFSELRQQLESRTLDPTHILTNLRAHACKSGFDFFDKKSFLRVSSVDKDLLPRPMVTELLDQQNAEIAKKVFSKEVESIMYENGDKQEGNFLKLVREWYEACDKRGIHPHERVDRWIAMHNFLIKDVDFGQFPPEGTHVKGIPIVTYEGLLQGISTRMNLYKLSTVGTYNNRAISTLGIESFFSSLSKADFTMTGCPKATQLHKIIPIMTDFNTHKHNPDKIFKMDPRRGAPYPYYDMEKLNNITDDENEVSQFKAHNFDKYVKKTKKRIKFKTTIDGLHDTERGKLTIRGDFYKFNASKLTGMQKLSLPDDYNV